MKNVPGCDDHAAWEWTQQELPGSNSSDLPDAPHNLSSHFISFYYSILVHLLWCQEWNLALQSAKYMLYHHVQPQSPFNISYTYLKLRDHTVLPPYYLLQTPVNMNVKHLCAVQSNLIQWEQWLSEREVLLSFRTGTPESFPSQEILHHVYLPTWHSSNHRLKLLKFIAAKQLLSSKMVYFTFKQDV